MGGDPWVPGSLLLYFRGNHVFGKVNTRKARLDGKTFHKKAIESSESIISAVLVA